ncbi:MAG: anthranilate synthase component I family protein [Desulfovibrionaceae bacterium]|nr:anthranilate synthase component I family protein [Desulfovibrionaceae bacterium]
MSTTSSTVLRLEQHARCLAADMETPISLFMGMASKGGILLESAEVDGRWGRYSVLACETLLSLHCRKGLLELSVADDCLKPLLACAGLPFVQGLRQVMAMLDIVPDPTAEPLPPMTRALYGYFGFGMAAVFNPRLSTLFPQEEESCTLLLPRTVIVMDHLYNRLVQVSIGEHSPLQGKHNVPESKECVLPEHIVASPNAEGYKACTRAIKELLRQGEAIQVVPSVRFSAPYSGDPFTLYRRMRNSNPSPYMFYMQFPHMTLLGASPEVMVRCSAGTVSMSPIAGTRKRGSTSAEDARLAEELRHDPKECAEHVMLVDLGRNDVGRIAKAGTVQVERLMDIERFSHVMHMTSRISGTAQAGLDALDILAATFPAGTVSGAPKIRAMEIIAEMEKQARGPYAGCIGWLGLDKDAVHMDTGITIRSMWLHKGKLHWQAGGGIVHDSDPQTEWEEVYNKSAIMRLVLKPTGEK